jgi:hypothetical protein
LELRCETIDHKVLWIPCFEIKSDVEKHNPNLLHEVKLSKDDTTYAVKHIKQSCEMTFYYDTDFNNNFNTYFKVEPLQADIVFTDDFLLAVVNYDLITEYNIPAVFLTVITKDKWIHSG